MKAFVLVDYTKDFVESDGKLTAGKSAQMIDGAIATAIEKRLTAGDCVFVINDLHLESDTEHPETKLFPAHNVKGTPGRDVYGKTGQMLKKYENRLDKQIFVMDKFRYSAFVGTALDILLRQKNIKEIELAGVCTDICILHTAISAYNLGYAVTIDASQVASFNADGHAWALMHFKTALGFTVKEK
ncbi:MAG: isochorismatase family cysteine hydrolase [Eubacterium sp.]